MKINSAGRILFGFTTAMGAVTAALPAGAATVTANDATGVVSGVGELIWTIGSTSLQCGLTFDLALAPGVSTGVQYTVPPATALSDVTGASFQPGTSYCNTVSATGLPWPITVNSITSSTTASVTVHGAAFSHPTFGNCTATNLNGVIVEQADGAIVVQIPPFVMPGTTPPGTPNGHCSSVGTITLTISAAVAPYFSLTYP